MQIGFLGKVHDHGEVHFEDGQESFTMVFISTELRWQEQERDQVRHLLDSDGGFQAFRHQRKGGAGKLRDGAAKHRPR